MAKVLVIRLSAIGDVAMTVPVIYSAAKANPEDSFTVLTQAFLMPLFMNRPPNVEVIGINTKGAEKGLIGLLKFISALLKFDFDVILDLHNVIRTILIGFVNPSFDHQSFSRLNSRIADNIFHMPLHSINPILQIQIELYTLHLIRIMYRGIYMIGDMICLRSLFKYQARLFAETHTLFYLSILLNCAKIASFFILSAYSLFL